MGEERGQEEEEEASVKEGSKTEGRVFWGV